MTAVDLAAVKARWSRDGGMGNERSADDYTDAGCRILAEHAFRDVPALIARVEAAEAAVARVRELAEQFFDSRAVLAALDGTDAS